MAYATNWKLRDAQTLARATTTPTPPTRETALHLLQLRWRVDCDGTCINDTDSDGVCDELEIVGCTDEDACNYDEAATDDGSCEYPAEGYDCDGNTVSVGSIDAVPNLSLFPNPMNADHAMVYLSGLPDEQTVIRVIASDGRVAWEGTGIVTNPGVVGYPIRESVTQGTYFIQVGSSTPFGSIPLMVW